MTPKPTMPTLIMTPSSRERIATPKGARQASPGPKGPHSRARIPSTGEGCPAASRLKQPLDELCRELNGAARVEQDAIQFPARYRDPADIELVGLFAACMAYGRVDLFGPWISWVLERIGDSPARFVESFDLAKHARLFGAFRYLFI